MNMYSSLYNCKRGTEGVREGRELGKTLGQRRRAVGQVSKLWDWWRERVYMGRMNGRKKGGNTSNIQSDRGRLFDRML